MAAPDGLRVDSIVLPDKLDYKKMPANLQICSSMLQVASYPSLKVKKIMENYTLLCGVLCSST
jgi:hypothetical protein